ncbi:hypothetical protein B296_00052771 [Ensete ventricosum]|uniref:Uncharacterized protein n=1 Tax=Ensete ventricosum TaxID=4639 RepID=A0A426X245_ENSVE|nr:hypothetical protein B296_00052771 [Ensete ventricosum]
MCPTHRWPLPRRSLPSTTKEKAGRLEAVVNNTIPHQAASLWCWRGKRAYGSLLVKPLRAYIVECAMSTEC